MATKPKASASAEKTKAAAPATPAAPRKRRTTTAAAAPAATVTATTLPPEIRAKHIATAAYFIAEKNGFQSEHALAHWVEAEAQIDAQIAQGTLKE